MRLRSPITIGPIEIERCFAGPLLALLWLICAQIVIFTHAGAEAFRYFAMFGVDN